MSKDKLIAGPRIRGLVYKLKSGEAWSYFIRVEGPPDEFTFHPDMAWDTEQGALTALREKVNYVLKDTGAIGVHTGDKK